jgi:site-specific recombinase XerD
MLDEWRGNWALDAQRKFDRIGQTSQSTFQGRLKQFCRWSVQIGFIERDPSTSLAPISKSEKRTQVLTPSQFEELLAAIEPFTAAQTGMLHEFAPKFRALFLL